MFKEKRTKLRKQVRKNHLCQQENAFGLKNNVQFFQKDISLSKRSYLTVEVLLPPTSKQEGSYCILDNLKFVNENLTIPPKTRKFNFRLTSSLILTENAEPPQQTMPHFTLLSATNRSKKD